MTGSVDIERIVAVLREATSQGGFSQRGLSRAAGEGRDAVGDIVNGRNRNPTVKVLSNLARAMGRDLSVFGLAPAPSRAEPPSADELEKALREVLPGMPRGSVETRARYLADTVSAVLGLPGSRQATDPSRPPATDRAADPLPSAPTS